MTDFLTALGKQSFFPTHVCVSICLWLHTWSLKEIKPWNSCIYLCFFFEVFMKLCNGRKMGVSVNSRYYSLYRIRRGKGVTLIRQEGQSM